VASYPDALGKAVADRYRLERELGHGGMATVFLAHDLKHHRSVAVKVLKPELTQLVGAERFLREIELTARLDHPHILPLLDSGDADGWLYYVMPYVEGESLRDRLNREKQLPLDDALQISREVADALSYAHSHGVVHRDIKPENILLGGGHARVADFGIARAITAAGVTEITTAGLAVGTPAYMSPEQAAGEKDLDGRSDVYSLACVLYEMLAGQPPFTGPTIESVVHQHLAAPPPSVRTVRSGVSSTLERAIARALAKTPADRHRTADQFAASLTTTAAEYAGDDAQARRAPRLALLVGAVTVAAAALASVLVWGAQRDAAPVMIGAASQLTAEDGLEINPAISPDGKLVVYAAGNAGRMRIWIRPVGGGRTIPLSDDSAAFEYQPRWSPDGTQILYLTPAGAFVASALGGASRMVAPRSRGGATFTGSSDVSPQGVSAAAWSPDGRRVFIARGGALSIARLDGGDEQPVGASPYELHSCDWSPLGDWIACASGNWESVTPGRSFGNIAPSAIVLVPAAGGRLVELTDRTSLHQSPGWSPDGRQLYFVSNLQGPRDVYMIQVSKKGRPRGAPRRVTVGLGAQTIGFSADGQHLVYVAYAARSNIWSLPIPSRGSIDASAARAVTSGNQVIESVRASRDGRWLMYDSNLYGNADIFRVPLAGGPAERLTTDPADDFAPDLSPDGREVAYHSWRTGSRDIFVRPLDGGPLQQVTATPSQESFPVWSPDGRAIVFSDQRVASGLTRGAFVTRRGSTGAWGAPASRRVGAVRVTWSPDGRFLAYVRAGGVEVIPPDSGQHRIVYAPITGTADPWAQSVLVSDDSRTLYFKSFEPAGGTALWAVPLSGGRPHLLVRFDDRSRPSIRPDFTAAAGRFFFTIEDRQSDVWVADVARR
jgi:eukaryotic-like serine/threonine-protein kinase